jgi:hypothetical protein
MAYNNLHSTTVLAVKSIYHRDPGWLQTVEIREIWNRLLGEIDQSGKLGILREFVPSSGNFTFMISCGIVVTGLLIAALLFQ